MSRFCTVLLILACSLSGQEAADFQAKVRAAMAQSLEKQKASVQRQAAAAQLLPAEGTPVAEVPGFFTVPWPAPVNTNVISAADCDPLPKDQLDPLVNAAAAKEGVKVDLIQAVIRKESAAKPCAVSPKGAQGLMQ